jgi:hypothetical protein
MKKLWWIILSLAGANHCTLATLSIFFQVDLIKLDLNDSEKLELIEKIIGKCPDDCQEGLRIMLLKQLIPGSIFYFIALTKLNLDHVVRVFQIAFQGTEAEKLKSLFFSKPKPDFKCLTNTLEIPFSFSILRRLYTTFNSVGYMVS